MTFSQAALTVPPDAACMVSPGIPVVIDIVDSAGASDGKGCAGSTLRVMLYDTVDDDLHLLRSTEPKQLGPWRSVPCASVLARADGAKLMEAERRMFTHDPPLASATACWLSSDRAVVAATGIFGMPERRDVYFYWQGIGVRAFWQEPEPIDQARLSDVLSTILSRLKSWSTQRG